MNEKMYTRDEVSEALRAVRDKTGLSCRELAERLDCSASTIVRLETGETSATTEMYDRLLALTVLGENYVGNATAKKTSGATGVAAGATAAGTESGLTVASMAFGLTALSLGSMTKGIGVIAAIPLPGIIAIGVVKGLTSLFAANRLNCEATDDVLEVRLKSVDPK